jgi:hypothetical protein
VTHSDPHKDDGTGATVTAPKNSMSLQQGRTVAKSSFLVIANKLQLRSRKKSRHHLRAILAMSFELRASETEIEKGVLLFIGEDMMLSVLLHRCR